MATLALALMVTGNLVGLATARAEDSRDGGPAQVSQAPHDAARYIDGVYTAAGTYGGLPSSITVTVTLAGGVITAVVVTPHATDPTSLDLHRRFAAAVPAVVVGRRIDTIKVDRLAGSSGTPNGFNAAIQRIREAAAR